MEVSSSLTLHKGLSGTEHKNLYTEKINECGRCTRMKKIAAIMLFILTISYFTVSAQGMIVFSDDFNRADGPIDGDWNVVFGSWTVEENECVQTDTRWGRIHAVAGDSSWDNFVITAKAKIVEGLGVILFFRYVDTQNWYEAFIRQDINKAVISKREASEIRWIATTPFECELGTCYRLRVEVYGTLIRFYINDALVLEATDTAFTSGKIGLGALKAHITVDDVEVNNVIPTNVVPEPGPLVASIIFITALASYMIFRRKLIPRM